MSYLFYLGLIVTITVLYNYVTVTVFLLVYVWFREKAPKWLAVTLFYFAKIISGYLVVSILLAAAKYYVASGLSPTLIPVMSYIALLLWWQAESEDAKDKYKNDANYVLAFNGQSIIFCIYTCIFCVMYFMNIPPDRYLSTLILSVLVTLAQYQIFVAAVMIWGAIAFCSYSMMAFNFLSDIISKEKKSA